MQQTHFGKYEVVELIGRGGFGQVFKGLDPDLKRPVAIKTCSLDQEGMRERFFKEAEIAARLQHPNITTVYDFGKVDGEPYMVQEYLPGEDLDQMIKRRDPITLGDKLRILLQVADGLRYAHSRGVVHRDVKPANIRVLGDGQVRIMDFGIAKLMEETQRLTQTGMTVGTAGFLSPEQLLGLDIDGRSDIFSFGVLAYELVTYVTPFKADSISALFYAIAYVDPLPVGEVWAECPPALAACLARCLEKDRDTRYQDFSEVMEELRTVLGTLEDGGAMEAGMAATAMAGAGAATVGSGPSAGFEGGEPTEAWAGVEPVPAEGAGLGAGSAAGEASHEADARRRRGKRILGGFGAVTFLVVAFEVLRFAMPGGASAPSGSISTGADEFSGEPGEVVAPQSHAGESSLAEEAMDPVPGAEALSPSRTADAPPAATDSAGAQALTVAAGPGSGAEAAADQPPAGAVRAESPTPGQQAPQPSAPTAATAGGGTGGAAAAPETAPPPRTAPQPGSPYRGTTTLVLLWSEGGDPASAITAENSFLEELSRRGLAVMEAGLLRGIHGDAAAMAMARGLDAGVVAELGRRYGAEVVVVGSLRSEWEPSVGRFYTGRAVLDIRAYSSSASELLRSSTQQVGTGNTPGKLGPSPLAAETEAAKEVGRMAAVDVARELGGMLPRR